MSQMTSKSVVLTHSEIHTHTYTVCSMTRTTTEISGDCTGAQDQRLGAEQDQLPHGPTGTSSGNSQETETRMAWAKFCHAPRHLSKTILQSTLGSGRRLGRQRKSRTDTVKEWTSLPMLELFPRKRLEGGCLLTLPSCPQTTQSGTGLNY